MISHPHWSIVPGRLEDADDAALVDRAIEGDDAFAELYERYAHRVFWFLLTSVGREEDAADLTQQVFLRALEALPHYENRGNPFGAWLFRIARNVLTDHHRWHQHRARWGDVVPDDLPSPYAGPERTIAARESMDSLQVAIGRLSPEKQELLALRLAGDLTCAEIAVMVGKSEAAVTKQLQRIVKGLKEQIDES